MERERENRTKGQWVRFEEALGTGVEGKRKVRLEMVNLQSIRRQSILQTIESVGEFAMT